MSIMAGILAGGQGLARGIDALGAQFADAREKEAFKQMLLNSGLVPQQQAAPMSLASLGQPNPQQGLSPMQAAPVAPVQTSAIPPINPKMSTPDNQGIMDRFAKERQTAWGGPGLQNSNNAGAFKTKVAGYDNPASRALYDAAIARGYTPVQAAAFVGAGALPESSLNPNARNRGDGRDGSDSIGMFQWNADRARNLQQFAAQTGRSWNDPQVQAEYALRELESTEGRAGQMLRQAQTPEQATAAMLAYLRPAGFTPQNPQGVPSYAARLNNTNSLVSAFTGQQPGPAQPLANVAPMQAPAPQQPMTLAQLAAPQQAPQMSLETLAGLATNRYGAPIAQQIIARQLGRDPMQQALQMEQLRAAQLGNQRLASEMAGESGKVSYQDLGDTIGVLDQRGNLVRTIPKGTKAQPLTVKEGETVINPATGQIIAQGGQKTGEFQKTFDKKNAEMFSSLLEQKGQVESDLADVQNLSRILPNLPTGIIGRNAARGANVLGVQTEAGANLQQFEAIVNRLVPSQRPPGSGTMSDRDVELFKSSLPGLAGTTEGNRRIIASMEGMARYKQQQSAIAEAVATGRMSQQDGIKALQAIPNPLAWVRQQQAAQGQQKGQPGQPGKLADPLGIR